jgi:hypothetical protein
MGQVTIPDKDLRQLIKKAKRAGWTVEPKKSGWMLLSPDGSRCVMTHGSCSDWRALKNVKSELRQAGLRC